MNIFRSMRVSTVLLGSFLICCGTAAIIGMVGIYSTSEVNRLAETMYKRDTMGLRDVARANQQLLMTARAIRVAALAPTEEIRSAQLWSVSEHLDNLDQSLDRAASAFSTAHESTLIAETRNAASTYRAVISRVADTLKTESLQQARASVGILYGEAVPAANRLDSLMEQLINRRLDQASVLSMETSEIYEDAIWIMAAITLGGVLLGLGLGMLITRYLGRSLGGEPAEVAAIANAVARGDLSSTIDTSKAHLGSIIRAMAHMQESLRNIVGMVRSSSSHIASGSEQIRMGNTDLAQRTEQQAADVTETAAAMDELSSTVSTTAEAMRQAAILSAEASRAAELGGSSIQDITNTMQGLRASSQEIVGIVALIDSIAFQTNILALNAAVEAARAGDQGRGFAVVAGEVRALAQKSAEAAREISRLIEDSAQRTDTGVQVVEQASGQIRDLVGKIQQVAQLIDSVDAATTEQTSGLGQINAAISQLNSITQQNAALVEESAAAASSLNEQAVHLLDTVRGFRIERDMGQITVDDSTPGGPGDNRAYSLLTA